MCDLYPHLKHPKVHKMKKVAQVIQESNEGKTPSYTKDELLEESKYDQLTQEERIKVAKVLLFSTRGAYLLARAMFIAADVMSLEEYPEYSDIDDMLLLMDIFTLRIMGPGEIAIVPFLE